MVDEQTIQKCLDALEEQEYKLLAWGDTDIQHTETELINLFNTVDPNSAVLLFQALRKHALILPIPSTIGQTTYRSRMAETVNLSKKLRQWFHNKNIQHSKTLVSDFRFVRRPRFYPRRDFQARSVINDIGINSQLNNSQKEALSLIIGDDETFKLSGFQIRATERILNALNNTTVKKSSGTIVCSGTGSGKTLSFYLPAISQLAQSLLSESSSKVRILAIYPRKELLRDQFKETFHQVRKLDDFLEKKGSRKIRIGTLFGDTFNFDYLDDEMSKGYASFDLLSCKCGGKFVWRNERYIKKEEVLDCKRCGKIIDQSEISLTRQSIPPDILFTTTEMVNQHLGNSNYNHLFGVGFGQSIPLVLLDEVHTYEGSTGAQTSYLLRRWMQKTNSRPHFVGLSATLSNASKFFADLVGVHENFVEKIEPLMSEMIEEGAEYMLALRGDPVSQTALLSTSIQTIMLLRRMLDNENNRVSQGTYGTKSFVFTDDLDVNNRLFEMLADAEGWEHGFGNLSPSKPPLAFLRSASHPNFAQQRNTLQHLGQDWSSAEYIGHSMDQHDRAIVSRTSSQDTGVDANANVIIATASLEVGFNDSNVGAVIQHKAPRGMASYVQRKGRAGRSRGMRPWMVTVLSDYGRDRIAFQRYESLIVPEIKPTKLPIENSHIQKMQACQAILDWLSSKIGKGNIWWSLKNPQGKQNNQFFVKLRNEVSNLIDNDNAVEELKNYLSWSLKISKGTVDRIFWQGPRSLMMDFIPSLHQKLSTNWASNGEEWKSVSKQGSPLPEFFPPTLFSELVLPTLGIRTLRGPKDNRVDAWESLGFFQGLKEYAPGRISKRYALNNKHESDWLVPSNFEVYPDVKTSMDFEIEEAFGNEFFHLKSLLFEDGTKLEIYKPSEILTSRVTESSITESSNAFLRWHSDFSTADNGTIHKTPQSSEWNGILNDITFFKHDQVSQIELTRYTSGSNSVINFKSGASSKVKFSWTESGEDVGIGTILYVDGIKWRFTFSREKLLYILQDKVVVDSLRLTYTEWNFKKSSLFKNEFIGTWVFECVFSAILRIGKENNQSFKTVLSKIDSDENHKIILQTPIELFQLKQIDENDTEEQTLQKEIQTFLSSIENLTKLKPLLQSLYCELMDEAFYSWAFETLSSTLSGGISNLVNTLLSDVADGDVNIDSVWTNDELVIWLTENEAGGVGIIDRLEEIFIADPLSVLNHLTLCFEMSEYEQVNFDIHQLLRKLNKDGELKTRFKKFREANDFHTRLSTLEALRTAISRLGITQTHSFNSIFHTRILKAGSTEKDDTKTLKWLNEWEKLEEKMGCEIPLVSIAYILARNSDDPVEINKNKNKIVGQLWPQGSNVRNSSLQFYNRFAADKQLYERNIVYKMLLSKTKYVEYTESWLEEITTILSSSNQGKTELRMPMSMVTKINQILCQINLNTIDYHGLLFHMRVSKIKRQEDFLSLFIEMAETIQ